MFFAVYIGPSMNPTLWESELIEVEPYGNSPLQVGDVVFFQHPESGKLIVHRIIRISRLGISTRGDNNGQKDSFLLQPANIKGHVVAAWRGQRRRIITGGNQGRLARRWIRLQWAFVRRMSSLIRPFYNIISSQTPIVRLLSASFQPKVVVFHTNNSDQYRVMLGRQVIGRYDNQKDQWHIQRPFRVLVDERMLPRKQTNYHVEPIFRVTPN
ncbi:MAG: S26 family signal peptidase [Candidatus Riflebacteria bacterium]|nr:S26 family signal peptidase [Candidatus Riflebacteria bacterium]